MLPDLTPTEWISIFSFSLSLAALALRFFIDQPSAKAQLLTAVLILAVLSVGITAIYSVRRATEVSKLANQLVSVLGNQEKTADQIVVDLNYPDMKLFASALSLLQVERRADSRIEQLPLSKERQVPVRLWRALASDGPR